MGSRDKMGSRTWSPGRDLACCQPSVCASTPAAGSGLPGPGGSGPAGWRVTLYSLLSPDCAIVFWKGSLPRKTWHNASSPTWGQPWAGCLPGLSGGRMELKKAGSPVSASVLGALPEWPRLRGEEAGDTRLWRSGHPGSVRARHVLCPTN